MALEIPPGVDLCTIPMGTSPDGSPMNLIDPPSLAPTTKAVTITLIIITFGFTATRIYTNLKSYHKLGLDDYLCLIAFVFTTAQGSTVMTLHKTARHAWDIPVCYIDESWLKTNAALTLVYSPAIWAAKTAVFALYIRLFNPFRWMRISCWICIVFFTLVYWSCVPPLVIYNFPFGDETWTLPLAFKGIKAAYANVVLAPFNLLCDIILMVLPLPIIRNLQISHRKKIGLALIFMTGIISFAAACVATYYRISLWRGANGDSTWVAAALWLTVFVELSTAIIVSCMPAVAASYKLFLKESGLMSSMRSLFGSASSLSKITSSSASKRKQSHSSSERQTPGESYELSGPLNGVPPQTTIYANKDGRHVNASGITRSVEVTQHESA